MVGTLTLHRVANVETELWTEEAPRPGKKETRRIRSAERKSGVTTTTPLRRRRRVVLASGNGVFCVSSPVLQTVEQERGVSTSWPLSISPTPAAHLAYLVFWKSSSLARVNIAAVPSAPGPGLGRGNTGSRFGRRSRLEGCRILGQLQSPEQTRSVASGAPSPQAWSLQIANPEQMVAGAGRGRDMGGTRAHAANRPAGRSLPSC